MSYSTETTEHGRTISKTDLPRFAKDLVVALAKIADNVKLLPVTEHANDHQQIMVGANCLDLHANSYGLKGRVNARLNAPDIKYGDFSTYDKEQKTDDATINPNGRSIDTIARDIKKRVIDANQNALTKRREHAAQMAAGRASIVKLSNALKVRLPGLDIRCNENERRAAIHGGSKGHYFNGTLMSDGTVSIERIGSMTLSKFERIIKILNEGSK